jgi:hypothetical protein
LKSAEELSKLTPDDVNNLRSAAQGLFSKVMEGVGDPKDAARLVYACSGPFDHAEFASHVMNVGGVGDIDDCRTFIDKKIGQPETIRRPDEALPEIQPGQSWCCEEGCGECTPVQVEFEYSRSESPPGVIVRREVGNVWVSHCCKAGLMLWDEGKQGFINLEQGAGNEQP